MSKGLLALSSNEFFEIKEKLTIGKGDDCEIPLEGELADKQVMIIFSDKETLIKNLDSSLPILVNKKILPGKFFMPLLTLSLIEIGSIQFIYSEDGPARPFQIKKVLEDFNMVEATDFDKTLMEKANQLQDNINELTQKVKPVIAEMEKLKSEITHAIKEKDQKIKELNAIIEEKTNEYQKLIHEKKSKFDQLKVDNKKEFDELNKNKSEIKKILKEASIIKASSILELDK